MQKCFYFNPSSFIKHALELYSSVYQNYKYIPNVHEVVDMFVERAFILV